MKFTWRGFGRLLSRVFLPVAKPILVGIVQAEGDALQARLREDLKRYGKKTFSIKFDKWQFKLKEKLFRAKWAPGWIRDKAAQIVDFEGDRFQAIMAGAAQDKAPHVFDAAFDSFQSLIISKIRGL